MLDAVYENARAMTTSNALTPSVCLLSFPPMIDSEACRFLLAHYGVSYREEAHLFGWASVLSLWHGWTPQIPLLYGKQYQLLRARDRSQTISERRCQP